MADRSRSRSRSPDRGAPPAGDQSYPPAESNGDAAPPPADAGAPPPADAGAGGSGDEVKLYVGNLDYGVCLLSNKTVGNIHVLTQSLFLFYSTLSPTFISYG